MKSQFLRLPLFVFLCLGLWFIVGCASSGNTRTSQPFASKLGTYQSARVEVGSSVPGKPEHLDEFMAHLESRVIAKLKEKNAFAKIYPAAATDSPADLRITVTITSVRDVNVGDRIMWGAFAGQARSKATVEVWELAAPKRLGAGEIEGESSGGSAFAGTTPQAVDRVADEVVRFVTENL